MNAQQLDFQRIAHLVAKKNAEFQVNPKFTLLRYALQRKMTSTLTNFYMAETMKSRPYMLSRSESCADEMAKPRAVKRSFSEEPRSSTENAISDPKKKRRAGATKSLEASAAFLERPAGSMSTFTMVPMIYVSKDGRTTPVLVPVSC
jgi:hypothetical protein